LSINPLSSRLYVARHERGQYGRLANENRIGGDAVLGEKTMIFGDPQRRNAFIAAWPMTDFRDGAAVCGATLQR
jgi:hypothetical protein